MNPQDLKTTGIIRPIDSDLTIETTWAHQCSIKNVRTVRGSNNDDAGVALKTIHLRQELVQGLFPFVVATT